MASKGVAFTNPSYEDQGARPKEQHANSQQPPGDLLLNITKSGRINAVMSSDTQEKQTGRERKVISQSGELPNHTSWNEVKVKLTVNGVTLDFSFDKELEPFAVQFASEDFKDYFDICDSRLKFQGLKDNVLHMAIEEQVQVAQTELRKELLELLQESIDDIQTFPIHDTDIPVLFQLNIKSDKARCYTYKDNIHICGHKKYVNQLMKTLAKSTVPAKDNVELPGNLEGEKNKGVKDEMSETSVTVTLQKDALVLLDKLQYMQQLQEDYQVTVRVEKSVDRVTITGAKSEKVDAAVNALRNEEDSISCTETLPQMTPGQVEELKTKLWKKKAILHVSVSGKMKLIAYESVLADIQATIKGLIVTSFDNGRESESDDEEETGKHRHDRSQSENPEDDRNTENQTGTAIVEVTHKCDPKFYTFLHSHGQVLINQLESEHNVKISLYNGEVMFKGTQKDIQRAEYQLNVTLIDKTVVQGNKICQLVNTEGGQAALDDITASHCCGWTMTQEKLDNEEKLKIKATWTKTSTLQKKHHLSVCVVDDYNKTDIPAMIVPVFTDQSPFYNEAAAIFCSSQGRKVMKLGACEMKLKSSSADKDVLFVAVAEKVLKGSTQEIRVPLNDFLPQCVEMFRKTSFYKTVGFLVPGSGQFQDFKHFMQNVAITFSGNHHSLPDNIMLCCNTETVASELFNAVQDIFHSTEIVGTLNRSSQVLLSKLIHVVVKEASLLELEADCIVVVIDRTMDMSRGVVPKALAAKAGNQLQRLLRENHPHDLDKGESFLQILPKPLPSGIKAVIFGCLPRWDKQTGLKTLKQFVLDCLHKAGNKGCSSIGFPAIGSGFLGYPHRNVARIMFDAVDRYSTEVIAKHVKTVTIAVYNQTDQAWNAMTNEEMRWKKLKEKKLKYIAGFPYLQTKLKDSNVKMMVKPWNDDPIPSVYIIIDFKVHNDNTSWLINPEYSSRSQFCWNDHMLVLCRNTPNDLSYQIGVVLDTCEKEKVTNIAVNCSHAFGFSVSQQIEIIVDVVTRRKSYSYLSNVLINTVDESGFQNAEKTLVPETTRLFSMSFIGSKPVWTKDEADSNQSKLVVFGFSKDSIRKSVQGIKEFDKKAPVSGSPSLPQVPAAPSSANKQKKKGPQAAPELSLSEINDDYEEMDNKDLIQKMLENGDVVAELTEQIVDQIESNGQKDKIFDTIKKDFNVKIICNRKIWRLCGPLKQLAEAEDYIYENVKLTEGTEAALEKGKPSEDLTEDAKQDIPENVSEGAHGYEEQNAHSEDEDYDFQRKKPDFTIDGISIFVYEKSITDTTVDAIVRPTNEYMDSSLGVAKVIADKAGSGMKDECEESLKAEKYLNETECRVTKAGKLNYNCIIHVFPPRADSKTYFQKLEDSVYNCLFEAHSRRLSSIAIPLIGTGYEKMRVDQCTKRYGMALKKFAKDYGNDYLWEVHFVDIKKSKLDEVARVFTTFTTQSQAGTAERMVNDKVQSRPSQVSQTPEQPLTKDRRNQNQPKVKHQQQMSEDKNQSTAIKIMRQQDNTSNIFISKLNVTVHMFTGNIMNIAADAVVCSEDENFSCKGRIAQQIQKMAGASYNKNIQQLRRENHKMTEAVAVVPEGSMSCKTVIHAIAPHWTREYTRFPVNFEQDISKTVENCLQQMALLQYTSIAFPLFGTSDDTSKRSTPVETCCRGMVTGLLEYFKRKSGCGPVKVFFVSTENAVVQNFKDELNKQIAGGNPLDRKSSDDWDRILIRPILIPYIHAQHGSLIKMCWDWEA